VTLGPGSSADEIVAHLKTLRNETNIAVMKRYAIDTSTALGITTPQMQAIVRQVKCDHERALDLWSIGLRDARMAAILTAHPQRLTKEQARLWAADFNSWELVDTAADLLTQAPFWRDLVMAFAEDEREFVCRTAFAMIAGASVHNKQDPDETLLAYLPLIEAHATDPCNFVRKAVNWTLRNIGKRSLGCQVQPWLLPRTWPPATTGPRDGSVKTLCAN
jgi:3-methyladenine DNA glycosylase AlkD